ncbi:protein argonaute 12-like [Phragmites australis]|uniref:protein argonaute 12-like n=1 Tax=Phragmites australis TaxID=29695 RepID=UPI002D767728|nr:protein argonaute 12-like [Phragmites australis]
MSTRGGGGRGRGRGGGSRGRDRGGEEPGEHRDATCGRGARGDRGAGVARGGRGAGESGGHFQAPQPAGGRGGYSGVAQGRGQVAAPTPAEVEALSRQVEKKMVVAAAQAGSHPQVDPSFPAPARAQAPAAAARVEGKGTVESLAAPAGRLPPASSKALVFPARPGYGTIGRRCRVRANHFLVQVADKDIYHYDVAITPESNSRERNRWIVNELVKLHKQYLNGRLPVYDGRKGMFTAGPLPFKEKQFLLKLTNPERANLREKEYKVTIKDAAKIDLYSLNQFLAGRQRELPQDTIQALDIALRECPSARYVTVSRSFFSKAFGHGGPIGSGVECWRGYYQSLRPTQMGLSLNIDISATAFYKPQPIIEFAVEYLNLRDASKRLSDLDRIKLKKALKGVRVVVTHRRDIPMQYRITGITSAPLNDLMFDQDGTRVSVVQYFKRQYNYSLKYTHWPCLQAGSDSRPAYIPMEVCNILEGQRYSRKLNERQVTAILKLACERPAQRESSILEVASSNNYDNDYYAKEFGIKVMNQPALVDARVLPAPRLKYHDSGKEKVCNPSIGQWNMINKRMVNGGSIKHWACLTFASRLRPNDIGMFCNDLVSMCNNIGMQMSTGPCVDIKQARQDNVEAAITSIHRHSAEVLAQQGLKEQQLELLIIILPDMSGFYGRIKRLCETELGVITQCCAPKNVLKGGKQYLENLALKINVKVGGRNTVLEDALNKRIPLLTDFPTIVFGADVTHPSPGEGSSPSIAAVVASMDWPQVTKYKCLVSSQGHRDEIINNLFTEVRDPERGVVRGGMVRDLLVSFYKSTGHKPHRIIFYRDGVSEGQFSQVLLYEMDAIRKACASLQEGYLPKVTFVVVQKRHHTRLFPENHRARDQTDRSGNILPGTVVDTKICHPSEFDFYLCSHSGIQGTSRPAHYHILFDENGFSADALQTLTYNLCYTYARCTRSVSIVPPAYYAHLGAFRARYYMEDDNSDQGSSAATSRTYDQSVPVRQLPRIKENVQQFMFYC